MTVWLLCVLLDYRHTLEPVCDRKPDEAACHRDMVEWVERAVQWQERSHLERAVWAACDEAPQVSTMLAFSTGG